METHTNGIRFVISTELAEHIRAWSTVIDELVFDEQLETGSFHGNYRVSDPGTLRMMRVAKANGDIFPYYGVMGSKGACQYGFSPKGSDLTLCVQHMATGDRVEYNNSLTLLKPPEYRSQKQMLSFSKFVHKYMLPDEAPPKSRPPEFLIDDETYRILKRWRLWCDDLAAQGNFIYWFIQNSIAGYAKYVEDAVTGESVDINDYDRW